jgi:ABC-type multidrug transport system permease subunit
MRAMIGSGLFGIFMLVCGFFLIPSNIPPYWIWVHYLSLHTYAFQAFVWNDFAGQTFTNVQNVEVRVLERLCV